jgi:hypothetical protein
MAKSGRKRNARVRQWIYGGVLFFAAAAGISLTAVPAIRDRLFDRIQTLKTAWLGETQFDITPVGENDIPYPEEFLRPRSSEAASREVTSRPSAEPEQKKRLRIVQSDIPSITPPGFSEAAGSGGSAKAKAGTEEDDSPRFQQGEIEREAYEKTLAANEKLAAMVQGGNPDLSFKTWDAARRSAEIYWVRVIFQNASGAEVEYIWQTDISSGRSAPLNYNSRSL